MKQKVKQWKNWGKNYSGRELIRKDFITDTRQIQFHTDYDGHSQLIIPNVNVAVNGISTNSTYEISELAHRQIATRLGIPFKVLSENAELGSRPSGSKCKQLVWQTPEKRMLRTLDGRLRAVESVSQIGQFGIVPSCITSREMPDAENCFL